MKLLLGTNKAPFEKSIASFQIILSKKLSIMMTMNRPIPTSEVFPVIQPKEEPKTRTTHPKHGQRIYLKHRVRVGATAHTQEERQIKRWCAGKVTWDQVVEIYVCHSCAFHTGIQQ